MSERNDRRIGRTGAFAATIIVMVVAVVGAALFFWFRMNGSLPSQSAAPQAQPASSSSLTIETLSVTLFYPANGMLGTGATGVRRQPDTQLQAREAATAVLADQRGATAEVLRNIKLRTLYLDASGTAYLDLSSSQPFQKEIRSSAWDELLAIYALVNTLTQNFEEIKQVRFLFDGREVQTLTGHIDLTRSYVKRMDLVRQ